MCSAALLRVLPGLPSRVGAVEEDASGSAASRSPLDTNHLAGAVR